MVRTWACLYPKMRKSELRRRAMFVFETICRRWWRDSSALIERRQTAWAKYKLSERCQQLSPVTSSYQFHLKINCFSVQFTFLQWINGKKAADYMPTLTRLIQWDTAYGRVQDQDVLSAAHVAAHYACWIPNKQCQHREECRRQNNNQKEQTLGASTTPPATSSDIRGVAGN